MENINFEDFQKLELKIGQVVVAEKIDKSDKLLRLEVDFGSEKRQVVSGIAKQYSPDEIKDKCFVFVTNLEPREILGLESQAMILAADLDGEAVLLQSEKEVPVGVKIR